MGGGLHNSWGSPSLSNVIFDSNSAEHSGGGMRNEGNTADPTLMHVSFIGNMAGEGGGMSNRNGSPRLTDAIFSNNTAEFGGGGMMNWAGSPVLTNVIFSGNSAFTQGGGMFNHECAPTLTNVVFSGNSVIWHGGGMYNSSGRNPVLTNVTFSGNSADTGAAMENFLVSNPTIQNSFMWDNHAFSEGDQIRNDSSSSPSIAHCDIQDSGGSGVGWDSSLGSDGGGNIDSNPLFVKPVDPALAPTTLGNLRVRQGSPAIDSGDNSLIPPGVTTDLDGWPRIFNGIVDMGAYESIPHIYIPVILRNAQP